MITIKLSVDAEYSGRLSSFTPVCILHDVEEQSKPLKASDASPVLN